MKKLKLILLGACFFILAYTQFGCLTYYGIANRGSENKYLEKPVYRDSLENEGYVGIAVYNGPGYVVNNIVNNTEYADMVYCGDISYHQGITGKHFSAAFGGAAHLGIYEQFGHPNFERNQQFFGGTLLGEISTAYTGRVIDWRYIGIRGAFFFEQGPYADFRRVMSEINNSINLHPNNIGNNVGVTSDLVIKFPNGNLGFYIFMGTSIDKEYGDFIMSNAIHFTRKNVTGILQMNTSMFIQSASIGIQYRLPDKLIKFNR